jgi:hypothetical protein
LLRPENARQKAALLRAVETFEQAYEGSPAQEYIESRGIGARTAAAHRIGYVSPDALVEGWERFAGRICIPYLNVNKEPVWAKFRANPLVREFKAKYAQQEGGRGRLFNLPALNHPGDLICLAEGELDVMTLTALGIPAVGVPGSKHWRAYMKRCLDGYGRVVLFYDDDENGAGKALVAAVKASIPDVIALAAPGGYNDLNDAYTNGFGDAIRRLAYGEEEREYDRSRLAAPAGVADAGIPDPERADETPEPAGDPEPAGSGDELEGPAEAADRPDPYTDPDAEPPF